MENEKNKEQKKEVLSLKLIKQNYAWVIAVVTAIGVLSINIFKFLEFIMAIFYFNFYDLSLGLYKYTDQSIIYMLFTCIFIGILFYRVLYSMYLLRKNFKFSIAFIKAYAFEVEEIVFFNFLVAGIYGIQYGILSFILFFCVFVILEFIGSLLLFRNKNFSKIKEINVKYLFLAFLRILPVAACYIILSVAVVLNLGLSGVKNYRIINDNKAIVYSNNDYYLTLDCEVEDNKLILYKGRQNKISTEDVYSELIKFDEVVFK